MKNKKIQIVVVAILMLVIGVVVGRLSAPFSDTLPLYYGCNQIGRWHADYLMREYGVTFDTNLENPKGDMNQKAGDLNGKLVEICFADPTE